MELRRQAQLIRFLQDDLAIPANAVKLALQHPELTCDRLPMILWQYGLITIRQLDQIFDWLEQCAPV
jgi:hypothetical protein